MYKKPTLQLPKSAMKAEDSSAVDGVLEELSVLAKKNPLPQKALESLNEALKPPPFSEISSAALKTLTAETPVTVRIGDTAPQDMTIYLPPPTKADLKAAESAHSLSESKRHKLLRKAMENKNSWLVAYMCAVRREKDSDLAWFDPNYCFYHEFASSRTLIAIACRDSTVPVAALLLQTDGIEINNNRGDYGDALWAGIHNEDQEQSYGILKMLCCYSGLTISNDDIKYAKTKTMRDLLSETRDSRPQAVEEKTAKALPESEKPGADGAVWTRLDSSSICKVTTDGAGFRLRRVFNFQSGTISESNEYLDAEGKVTSATAPAVTRFGAQGSRREIIEAQERLKALNSRQGNTPPKEASADKLSEKPEQRRIYAPISPRIFF